MGFTLCLFQTKCPQVSVGGRRGTERSRGPSPLRRLSRGHGDAARSPTRPRGRSRSRSRRPRAAQAAAGAGSAAGGGSGPAPRVRRRRGRAAAGMWVGSVRDGEGPGGARDGAFRAGTGREVEASGRPSWGCAGRARPEPAVPPWERGGRCIAVLGGTWGPAEEKADLCLF